MVLPGATYVVPFRIVYYDPGPKTITHPKELHRSPRVSGFTPGDSGLEVQGLIFETINLPSHEPRITIPLPGPGFLRKAGLDRQRRATN